MNTNIPTSEQDFEKIITNNELYIDKTEQIYNLIKNSTNFFLSKPRRFGKSLLLSTIRDLFMGKSHLFDGLYIKEQTDYDFEQFPIIYISFAGYNAYVHNNNIGGFLNRTIKIYFNDNIYKISDFENFDGITIGSLIEEIYFKFNKKAILLIDEYDKIATSNYGNSEINKYIEILSGFYSGLKDSGAYLRFSLISGLTTILQNDIYSTMNHLNNITNSPRFYDITGYTYNDIIKYFDIKGLASYTNKIDYDMVSDQMINQELNDIKDFYNGYNFGNPDNLIYNPFDINLLFFHKKYSYYWAETGRAFLIDKYLKKTDNAYYLEILKNIQEENIKVNNIGISSFDKIDEYALLYQAGYLTINKDGYFKAPNKETLFCLTQDLLNLTFSSDLSVFENMQKMGDLLYNGLIEEDENKIIRALPHLEYLLSTINYLWTKGNPEGIMKTIISWGLRIQKGVTVHIVQEGTNSQGISDIIIYTDEKLIIIEGKANENPENAINQINDQYLDHYKSLGYHNILKFGINRNSYQKAKKAADGESLTFILEHDS